MSDQLIRRQYDELAADNGRLLGEIARLRQQAEIADGVENNLVDDNNKLREALNWYADIRHYDDMGVPGRLVGGGWAGDEPQDADWDADYGETARKVLNL